MVLVHFWNYLSHLHLCYCYVIWQVTVLASFWKKWAIWLKFGDFTSLRWKTKLCIFATIYCFTYVKGRKCIKLVKSCVKFTVIMLYMSVSANNGSWNSVLVISISRTLLGHEGWWCHNKSIGQVKPMWHDTRYCRNIEHSSFKCLQAPE